MRILQTLLFVTGSTALGAVSSAALVYALMRAFLPAPRGELNYGGAFALFGFLICSGALGAIAGFVTSLSRSPAVSGDIWRPATWLGIALGGAAGVALCFTAPNYNEFWLTFLHATCLIAACATAGGLLAAAVSPLLYRPASKPDRRKDRSDHRPPSF